VVANPRIYRPSLKPDCRVFFCRIVMLGLISLHLIDQAVKKKYHPRQAGQDVEKIEGWPLASGRLAV
jgi:hypothetical protein